MRATAGGGWSDAVDLYNSETGTWSTAQLSVARFYLAATSVGDLAIFAGGQPPGALGRGLELMVACVLIVCLLCIIIGGFALRALAVSCAPMQLMCRMPWICTTV